MDIQFNPGSAGMMIVVDPEAVAQNLRSEGFSDNQIQVALKELESGDFSRMTKAVTAQMRDGGVAKPEQDDPARTEAQLTSFSQKADSPAGLNMSEVMKVLFEAAQELRDSERVARHVMRDAAVTEATLSAETLRSSAWTSLAMGIVSGTLSAAMGVTSATVSSAGLKKASGPTTKMNEAKFQNDKTAVDLDLAKARTANAPQTKIDALASKATRLNDKQMTSVAKQRDQFMKKNGITEKDGNYFGKDGKALANDSKEFKTLKGMDDKLAECAQCKDYYASVLSPSQGTLNPKTGKVDVEMQPVGKKAVDAPTDEKMLETFTKNKKRDNAAYKDAQLGYNVVTQDIGQMSAVMMGVRGGVEGANQLLSGVSGTVSAILQADAKEIDAEAAKMSSIESESAELQKTYEELRDSAMETIRAYTQSNNEVNSKIFQNM